MDFPHDLIWLLIGTRTMSVETIAIIHKVADTAIQMATRPDSRHWTAATSANVSKNTRAYQNGMKLSSTRARALAAGR